MLSAHVKRKGHAFQSMDSIPVSEIAAQFGFLCQPPLD